MGRDVAREESAQKRRSGPIHSTFTMRIWGLLFLLFSVEVASVKPPVKKRVLVILENEKIKETHSMFFEDLKGNGFVPTFKLESDKNVVLEKWGEYHYDNLILFAPGSGRFGKRIGIKEVMDFVDSGRNVIVVGSPELSKRVSDVASECGVDMETSGSRLVDHVRFARTSKKGSDHELVVVEAEERVMKLFNKRKKRTTPNRPLLFRGIAHKVAPDGDFITVALAANPTSYSYNAAHPPTEETPLLAGRDATLISLMQTLNNARVAVVGSMDFFSDELFTLPFTPARHTEQTTSGNREFAQDLVLWTFQSIGVLRTRTPRHYHRGTGVAPTMYTIKDPIHFEVDISELVVDKWVPYKAKDVQVEYFMMYPYIRTHLQDRGNGTFAVDLHAPDVYGVFKFLVTYHRPGYSNIDITEMAPIRPFRHDEYERFILAAYPYYASVFSMMTGFWLFGILYLYHK